MVRRCAGPPSALEALSKVHRLGGQVLRACHCWCTERVLLTHRPSPYGLPAYSGVFLCASRFCLSCRDQPRSSDGRSLLCLLLWASWRPPAPGCPIHSVSLLVSSVGVLPFFPLCCWSCHLDEGLRLPKSVSGFPRISSTGSAMGPDFSGGVLEY
ncbi:hypothetical protein NDU88_006008 [Pleurodeles waltl]|uniref:Uncharacterized protein n=1 Tax=Pleurodeles waltl TaxID=8319 RepID=A0AAV7QGE6_PLEWA|nr:hypothetical protein NDU88_006008 [Pleurodeles waltl]